MAEKKKEDTMKNIVKLMNVYGGVAFVNGAICGDRYWKKNVFPKLHLPNEEPLLTREILDRGMTVALTGMLNWAPPIFFYSLYNNAQRVEIWWRNLDPNKFNFYYDRL